MKNKSCITAILLMLSCQLSAQDHFFDNPNQSLVALNPSFAGSNGLIRNQLSYRNQWPSLSNYNIVLQNSFDAFIRPLKAGLAFSGFSEHLANGILITSGANFVYAQHLTFCDNDLKITPSLQFSYVNRVLNLSSLYFGTTVGTFTWNTPGQIPSSRKNYMSISSGLLATYKKDLLLGFSLFHINSPDEGLLGVSRLPYRFLMHASYTIHFTERTLAQVFYRFSQQRNVYFHQVAVNTIISKHLILGAGYILNNNPHLNLGYRWDQFSIVFGYGTTFSGLSESRAASSELHLSYNLRKKEIRKETPNFENM